MSNHQLIIPLITYNQGADMLTAVSPKLDNFNKQLIAHALWLEAPEKLYVRFATAHGGDMLFLKYYVREKHIAAVYRDINDPVYKDSCVEFFIGFGDDPNYYNLEFNCAGNMLGLYGPNKRDRRFLDKHHLMLIRTEAHIKFDHQEQVYEWELAVAIPTDVFEFHRIRDFAGMNCRLNFYKCGDDLPVPHYLAWSPVFVPKPDFHRPEFFGKGAFEHIQIQVEQ